jgi:hypothetical protein
MSLALFLSQALSLLLELALFRFLSIEHFHQFASVTVGVVLAGYGFSGFLIFLLGRKNRRFYDPVPYISAFPVAITSSILFLFLIKVEPSHLLVSPEKALLLFFLFLVFGAPFAISGAIVGSAFSSLPLSKFRVYALSMVGAGTGVLLWLPLSRFLSLKSILAVIVIVSTILVFMVHARDKGRTLTRLAICLFSFAGVLFVSFSPQPLSEYKALSQFFKIGDSRVLAETFDIDGEYLAGSTASLHVLPGLSPRYGGAVPEQIFAYLDGNVCGWSLIPSPGKYRDLLGFMPESAPFLKGGTRALITGYDSGVLQAIASGNGYGSIVVAESRKGFLSLMGQAGRFDDERGMIVPTSPLHYVRNTAERFDLIFIPEVGSLSYSMMYGKPLSENYLFTREVMREALGLLTKGGIIALSGWSKNPLREEGKILNLFREILPSDQRHTLAERVIVVYGYSRFVIMITPDSFDGTFIDRVGLFLQKTGFPAIVKGLPVDGDYRDRRYEEAMLAFLRGDDEFVRELPFSFAVPDFDKPYFYRFFRLGEAGEIYRELGRTSLVFFESGYLMLLLSLAVVTLWGTAAILVPSLFVLNAYSRKRAAGFGLLALGVLCGFGYTMAEMILVGRASFFFRSYTEGFLAVLAIFLTFSGLGAVFGEKFSRADRRMYLFISPAVVLLLFMAAMLPFSFRVSGFFGKTAEVVVFVVLCGTLSFLLGLYLPPVLALMQEVAGVEGLVALWGVNNFSSLLGSLVTPVITVSAGFFAAFFGVSAAYLIFAALFRWRRS